MGNFPSIQSYAKLEEIGRGSFGIVYKAKNKETKEFYAVKVLHPEFNKNLKNYIKALDNEISIYSKLDHPCILPFYGASYFSFNDERRPAIVVKYAPNGSLDQIFDYGKQHEIVFWNNTTKLCIIYGIASAMSYLHENNVIHCDLKPSNILLDEYMCPYIADFGLSQAFDNKNLMSTASSIKGTAIYTAPEIWEDKEITESCDVYSFGLLLYSIFANEEPFEKRNYNQYKFSINVIQNGERPEFTREIPTPFWSLMERCWSQDPKERPTFKEILNDLATKDELCINGVNIAKYRRFIELLEKRQIETIHNEFQKVDIKTELKKFNVTDPGFDYLFTLHVLKLEELPYRKREAIRKIIFPNDKETCFDKIVINPEQVVELYENEVLDSHYLLDLLKFFDKISIEIKYPASNYPQIWQVLSNVKRKENERIKFIIIVENVNAIGREFKNNNLVNKFIIKEPVSSISEEAFRGCIALTSIEFPSTLRSIEHSTFRMCESLKKVVIPKSVPSVGEHALRGCHNLIDVTIPSSVGKIGKSCFRGDNHMKIITLPENLTVIEKSTFKGCVQLITVNVPPSVTKIEQSAFEECQKLKKIVIPPSVTVIEPKAFRDCAALTHIYFDPTKTTEIDENAFYDCDNLQSLVITTSESEITIDIRPFPNVKKIFIPQSVVIENPIPGIQIIQQRNNFTDCGLSENQESSSQDSANYIQE